EQRIGSPLFRIARAALGTTAAAPFVGEENLGAAVVEGRRMPVREVRVRHRGGAARVGGILDVDQETVAFAGAAGHPYRGIERDVVAAGHARMRVVRAALRLADQLANHLR